MSTSARTFYLAPEWRRMPHYLAVFSVMALTTVKAVNSFFPLDNGPDPSPDSLIGMAVFHALALLVFYWWLWSWRLRIDAEGVHWFNFYWRHWTWKDFESGEMKRIDSARFVYPEKQRGLRRLTLAFLSEEDLKSALALIDQHWVPYEPEDITKLNLRIRSGLLRKKTVMLHQQGIDSDSSGMMRSYVWNDVVAVNITKLLHAQQGFKKLELCLPDTAISFVVEEEEQENWKGTTQIELLAFLRHHLPPERLHEAALDEVSTKEDVEAQLEAIQKSQKNLRRMLVLFPLLVGLFWLRLLPGFSNFFHEINDYPEDIRLSTYVLFLFVTFLMLLGTFIFPIFAIRMTWHEHRKRIAELRLRREL
jgi:hypothetical protein